jgi:hypothetical protein
MGRWTDRPVDVVAVQILPLQSAGTPITRALAARRAHTGERVPSCVFPADTFCTHMTERPIARIVDCRIRPVLAIDQVW